MVLNSLLCKVTLQIEIIQTLFSLNGGLVLQKEKESIDVDDLFRGKALRLWNENHDCTLLRRTHYFLQHKAKICGCSIKSALTKEIESIKKKMVGGEEKKVCPNSSTDIFDCLMLLCIPQNENSVIFYLPPCWWNVG